MQKILRWFLVFGITLSIYLPLMTLIQIRHLRMTVVPHDSSEEDEIILATKLLYNEGIKHGFIVNSSNITYVFINNPSSQAIATCYLLSAKYKFITINKFYWKDYDFVDKKMILWHELAHCTNMRRGHLTDHASIMNPNKLDRQIFLGHYEELLDELFDPRYLGDINNPQVKK